MTMTFFTGAENLVDLTSGVGRQAEGMSSTVKTENIALMDFELCCDMA